MSSPSPRASDITACDRALNDVSSSSREGSGADGSDDAAVGAITASSALEAAFVAVERGNGDEGVGGKAAADSVKANGKPVLPPAVELKSVGGAVPSSMTDVEEAVISVGEKAKDDGDEGEMGRRVVVVEKGVLGGRLPPLLVAVEAEDDVMEPRLALSLPIGCSACKRRLSPGGSKEELNWWFRSLGPLGSELMLDATVPEDEDDSVSGNESKPDETGKSAVSGRFSWEKRPDDALACGSREGEVPMGPATEGTGNVSADKTKLPLVSVVELGLEELRLGVRAVVWCGGDP